MALCPASEEVRRHERRCAIQGPSPEYLSTDIPTIIRNPNDYDVCLPSLVI